MKLAANLTWLYAHLPLAQRFDAAARDGFTGVEVLFPYDETPAWYTRALKDSGLVLALFNAPVDEGEGRMGWAAIPGRQAEFRAALARALDVAQATDCRKIHLMVGHTEGHDRQACHETLQSNLAHAIEQAAPLGVVLALEPLNRTDMAGYFYHLPSQALDYVRQFDSPHLRLQFDFYHCMKESLDLEAELDQARGWIGHAQIAGVAGRYEPDLSAHRLHEAVQQLQQQGYDGWLGCEHRPRTTPAEGLAWCQSLRDAGVLS